MVVEFCVGDKYSFENHINVFSKLIYYIYSPKLSYFNVFSTLIYFIVFLRILKMVIEFCAGDKYPFENHINVFSKLIYYSRGKKDTPATKELWSRIVFFKRTWLLLWERYSHFHFRSLLPLPRTFKRGI